MGVERNHYLSDTLRVRVSRWKAILKFYNSDLQIKAIGVPLFLDDDQIIASYTPPLPHSHVILKYNFQLKVLESNHLASKSLLLSDLFDATRLNPGTYNLHRIYPDRYICREIPEEGMATCINQSLCICSTYHRHRVGAFRWGTESLTESVGVRISTTE